METFGMIKTKIAVLTGTRAEYGILRPILKKVDAHPKLELILIVTGMHLSDEFGYTVDTIKKDGFEIDAEIATLNVVDTGYGMARYIGKTIIELSDTFNDLNPDIIFLLGDRAEMLAGAIAAACANILIAHIHSGEASGSIDQSFRHAISKLSHLFFVATEDSRDNLLAIGEEQKRIFIVGAPGLDGILENLHSPENMAKKYNLDLSKPVILLVQHPVVTETQEAASQMRKTLNAIAKLKIHTIVIYPNADAGGRKMIEVIKAYDRKHSFIDAYKSLPRRDYLSLMNIVSVMVGNSSSGIIEAPSFGLPVINIGTRQKDRLRAGNTIEVDHDENEIVNGIRTAINDIKYREKVKEIKNPWGDGNSSEKILEIIGSLGNMKKYIQK